MLGFRLFYLLLALILAGASSHAVPASPTPPFDIGGRNTPEIVRIQALLEQPEQQLDLAEFKLTIDKMIDPKIDIKSNLKALDQMVVAIRELASSKPSSMDTMLALKRFLHEPGPWNDHREFQYDFDDPMGTRISNKLLPTYMTTRKGNCVSMPLLFIVLGQKLGIDVTASTAPLHVFVKFTDDATGITHNLETTSGANFSRDAWYRQQMPMTDQAVASGIYLQRLTKKETAVVMATTLTEYYSQQKEHEKAIALSELLLEYDPKAVALMLRSGTEYRRKSEKRYAQYHTLDELPAAERGYYQHLYKRHHYWFTKATTLGWHRPGDDEEERYIQMMKQEAKSRK